MRPRAHTTSTEVVLPAWVFDLAQALISIAFGLGLLLWRQQTLSVVLSILALYIFLDGVFDVFFYLRNRRRQDIGRARLAIGLLSCVAAAVTALHPEFAFSFFVYYLAARSAFHGFTDLWELVTSFKEREASPLLLIRGTLLIVAGGVLVVAGAEAVQIILDILAVYLILDGLGYLAAAAVKRGRFAPRRPRSVRAQGSAAGLARPPRAVVFVRRSGAKGMGHVGWAFEWRTRWFNVGSVENRSNAAFAPPDKMDFWTTHTLQPIASMLEEPAGYDEFKVFQVAEPQAKAAWKTVVWLSRQPYSVLRRNCADCTCDVLRAYGVASLVDTAQENVPNRWYDRLPGPSYSIREYPEIPLDAARAPRLARLPVREIKLTIPARIKAPPPPWRARGGRAWYEVQQRWLKITMRARDVARGAAARWRAYRARITAPTDDGSAAGHPSA